MAAEGSDMKSSASLLVTEPERASSGLMERTLHHVEILDLGLNWIRLSIVHPWKRDVSFLKEIRDDWGIIQLVYGRSC